MNEIRETISNYASAPSIEYCRLVVRQRLSWGKADKEELKELGTPRNPQAASSYTTAEQEITDALCASLYIPEEEFKIFDATAYEKVRIVLAKLRSSKEYPPTRTSPIVNKLNEIWLISAAGFSGFVDINRVHRNFFYNISSSDQVEDYLQFSVQEAGGIRQTSIPRLPPGVRAFCTKEGILNYVPVATEIIEQSFQQIDKIGMAVEEDPETGERWLLIAITVYGEVGEILEQYERYTEQWIAAVPWPERDKIRLSFNII
jgi:hypothetical protein